MSRDIEYDPIRDDQHDQLPTVDQILVDRGQGKGRMVSGSISTSTLAQADDPQKKGRYCSWWNVAKYFLLFAMIIFGFAVGALVGERKEEEEMRGGRLNVTQQDLIDPGFAILGGSEFDDSKSYQSSALNVLVENGVSADDDPTTVLGRQKLAQRYALLCLYFSTNRIRTAVTDAEFGYGTTPQWHNTNAPAPWKFQWGEDECDWSGIVCNGKKLVKRIELVNHLLTGFLPLELVLLDKGPIEVLDFSDNRGLGQGGFPKVFMEFKSLESIDLRGTSFIGKVPEELCEQETINNIFIDCNMIECSGDCCSACDSARADIDIDSAITQASPTDAPIASPTDAPIDCGLPLSCLGCLQQDCYYGNGGGMGSCHNCKHQKEQCNGKTGFCNIFPDNDDGRLQCISYIKETCPGDR